MIDIHCHILPGVDDGAKSWAVTLEMCNMALADGVGTIVASPHANDEFSYSRESHSELLAELQEKFPEIKFVLGCDFHLSPENIADALSHPQRYSIGSTRYLLVEYSDYLGARFFLPLVARLIEAGFTPIVTHPERNPVLRAHPDLIRALADRGCLIQVTANSITGFWGRESQATAEHLLKDGLVHVIASDAHEARRRTPLLSEAARRVSKLIGAEAANRLVNENPSRVVDGVPLY